MRIAVVGATGLVGREMIRIMEERELQPDEFIPVASARSVGQEIVFNGKAFKVVSMEEALKKKPEIAIFSAGGSTSKEWAPKFAEAGTTVIDNSSAWRMNDHIPLVVPEINAGTLTKEDKIIANPNCSTIQMVLALSRLHWEYNIQRLVISTYQSVSGTGKDAVQQMDDERMGKPTKMVYPYPIDMNLIPHGGDFEENGYTTEETKLVNETRKILSSPHIRVTATVVRVPVIGGHSESLNVEFEKDFDLNDIRNLLTETPGIVLQDDPEKLSYPMPKFAHHKDEVFVGRIRRDFSNPNTLNMWVVADNLRKGAATNAVQIAQYLIENKLV
ncbi:MAG: aspartate-semialdehyde dehydrogenase [Bacteroidales bacterium]|nr:aspartate-semialdehyde dehydrogenase [Bacteroidales bacterium]